jgi:hypothetical protein
MRRLVEFPLEEGGSVLVEVDDAATAGSVTRGLRDQRVTETAQQSFEQAVSHVQPATNALLARLRGMADAPDEVVVAFGLQLSAEAGAFIASASTSATFNVSLTWRRRSDQRSVQPAAVAAAAPAAG